MKRALWFATLLKLAIKLPGLLQGVFKYHFGYGICLIVITVISMALSVYRSPIPTYQLMRHRCPEKVKELGHRYI